MSWRFFGREWNLACDIIRLLRTFCTLKVWNTQLFFIYFDAIHPLASPYFLWLLALLKPRPRFFVLAPNALIEIFRRYTEQRSFRGASYACIVHQRISRISQNLSATHYWEIELSRLVFTLFAYFKVSTSNNVDIINRISFFVHRLVASNLYSRKIIHHVAQSRRSPGKEYWALFQNSYGIT